MKKVQWVGGALALVLGSAACSSSPTQGSAEIEKSSSSAPVTSLSVPPVSNAPTARVTTTMDAALTFTPSDFTKLAKDPKLSLVVRGVVANVEYRHDPVGTAYTLVTLDVDKTWRGKKTAHVTYMELGGFIKQADLDAINGPKDGMPRADPKQVVDEQFLGAPHSRVGERQIVFLHRVDGEGYDYEALQGPYGTYRWKSATKRWGTHRAETIPDPTIDDGPAENALNG